MEFFKAFIPIFVSIDVIGILPLFMGLTHHVSEQSQKKLVTQATFTALGVAFLFLIAGRLMFKFLGITESDFRIGGGIVLLVLSVMDLLVAQEESSRKPSTTVGVVPIGIPLIMGPAALTTILMTLDSSGYVWTSLSLVANLALVWLVFSYSRQLSNLVGDAGAKAVGKVASLFLVAIAVMMIRRGLTEVLTGKV